jgi:ABC-2 type transport system permease protein
MSSQDKSHGRARSRRESMLFVVATLGVLIFLNIFAATFGLGRFDCTRTGIFSLSEGSRELARNLDDRLEIVAYFSANLPPPHNATERYVRDLLAEYAAASGGKIRVTVVAPETDAERRQAESDGVRLVAQRIFANDSVSVVEGYRGIVLQYLGEKKSIPIVENTTGLEYRITMAMKELVGEKAKLGLLTTLEPQAASELFGALKRSLRTYQVVDLDAKAPIDPSLTALLVLGLESPLDDQQLANVDRYVASGGSLGVFGGTTKAGQGYVGQVVDTGVNRLLRPWGVTINDDLVADEQCEYAPVQTQLGPMPRRYPYRPILAFSRAEREHPVISGLMNASLPFVSSLTIGDAPAGATVTVLGQSSERSFSASGPMFNLDPSQTFYVSGALGRRPVLAAIEGTLPSALGGETSSAASPGATSRVFVAGSAAMTMLPIPEGRQVDEQALAQHLALVLNAIDWLANDRALVAIRAKDVDEPRLDVPTDVLRAQEDIDAAVAENDRSAAVAANERGQAAIESWNAQKVTYRVGFALGLPLIVGLFGIYRWRRRRAVKAFFEE